MVFETTTAVPPDAWVRVNVAPTVPSAAGRERPQGPSEFTIKVEPTFFVDGFYCTTQCPADAGNPFRFTTSLRDRRLRRGRPGHRHHDAGEAGAGGEVQAEAAAR